MKCIRRLPGLLLAGLAGTAVCAPTAPPPLPIHRIALDGALVQNTVVDMLQDRSGLMWFATLGGLNVYDGYEFREIPVDPDDPRGLSGLDLSRLFEDREGHIWVAGGQGWLDRLDTHSGEVRRFPPELYGRSGHTGFAHADDGSVWLGTPTGLHRYDPATDTIQTNVDRVAGRSPLQGVRELLPDGEGRLWVGTTGGLYRYWIDSQQLEDFADEPGSPQGEHIAALHLDPDRTLWVGSHHGLARRDADGDGFVRYRHDPANPRSLGGDLVTDILRDSYGRLWVASQSGGLSLWREGGFDVYRNDPDDPGSIAVDDVWSLYQDRSGLVWIGTAGGGLNQVNPVRHRFRGLRSIPHQEQSLRSGFVRDIAEDPDGRVWMATLAGLEVYDPAGGTFELFEPAPGDVAGNQMQSVHIDEAGQFWVGAVDGALYRFDPGQGAFRTIGHPARPQQRFADGRIWYIGGAGGRIWVARQADLVVLDAGSGTPLEHITIRTGVPAMPVRTSLVDSDGALWLGGGIGLLRIAADGARSSIEHDPDAGDSLSANSVRSLHEDADGGLWVGTHRGLNYLRPQDRRAARNRFEHFGRAQGLANETVYGIVPGVGRRLWLSTNQGLSRFDPDTGEVRNYTTRDGLPTNEMNGGAELVASDGTVYFGGLTGVAIFRPDAIGRNDYVPPVRFTRMEVSGEPSFAGLISVPDAIALGPRSGALLLEFASMDFHQPENNRFRYRLTGASGQWTETARNSVSLAQLLPGDYRFEVLGSNGDGVWSTTPTTLDVFVAPPLWRNNWAYTGYGAGLLALVLGYHGTQRRKLRREREFNEQLTSAHSLAEANHQMALRYAQFDHLTQLPNRASLTDALGRYMRFARAQDTPLALLLVNLDRFQRINDTMGHRFGDGILKETARRLQSVVRSDDLVARVGGDEFALIALRPATTPEPEWLAAIGSRLMAVVGAPHGQEDPPLRLGASIGVATYSGAADQGAGELMGQADIAMHAVKRDSGNGIRRYEPGMLESARERLGIEGRMRRALDAGEFAAHYQPLIDLQNGRVSAFEALIRWNPPGQAPIYPDQFIPVAEESGLIEELGAFMIGAACRQLAIWKRPGLKIAVNVSMRQLRTGSLVDTIRDALAANGVPADALKIEITETAMMQNVEDTAEQLQEISRLGVGIAIDDFGTGFSSLSHLRMLPVDELKIDRSFVTDLGASERNRTIVSSIVRLAHELKLAVVAEGVEDEAALAYLRSIGCDLAQGYLFDRPQPPERVRWQRWDEFATRWFRNEARAVCLP
ncbi:MAG TPA: EAL domain-containing protein [Xanthomonadaceae bacterium]|nr:EAL domain-containing protein [Xanthomonadaceae bacterium]